MFIFTRTWDMDKFYENIGYHGLSQWILHQRSNILDSANRARKLMNISQNPSEL